MTVQDLIAELQRYPAHAPVRCLMETVICTRHDAEPDEQHPAQEEALEVTNVEWRGYDVLLFGCGMAAG